MAEPVFLGARVDLSCEPLPEPFAQLQAAVDAAISDYRRDGDEARAADRLAELTVTDEHGREWTVGASTGRWMWREPGERRWHPGHPAIPPAAR